MRGRERPEHRGSAGTDHDRQEQEERRARRAAREREALAAYARAREEHEPVRLSALLVPAVLVGLLVGTFSGYVLGPWGGLLVLALLLSAGVLAVARPDHREAALAGGAAALLAFGGVMVIALLHLLG